MPRSVDGIYTLPELPFVSGQTIQSAPVNSDFSDIADALTQSLATTGVSEMTGPIKAADGSVTAPSMTFVNALGTGFYLSGSNEFTWVANGVPGATFNSDLSVDWVGEQTFVDIVVTGDITGAGWFPSGFTMIARQTAAPTGWTKTTSNVNDRALRVTSGTISQGGTFDFSDVFGGSWESEDYTLLIADMPLHGHPWIRKPTGSTDDADAVGGISTHESNEVLTNAFTGTPTTAAGEQLGGTGGSGAHAHDLDLEVLYLDVIVIVKD